MSQENTEKIKIVIKDSVLSDSIERALSSYVPSLGIVNADEENICVLVTDQFQNKKSKHAVIYLLQSKLESMEVPEKDIFIVPFRIGGLIDRVQYHIRLQLKKGSQAIVIIGSYKFTQEDDTLMEIEEGSGPSANRLTEKECRILYILQKRNGKSMGRKDLLKEVWGYVDSVETHTLETHIYRLRQKLEANPAEPKILLTAGTGYKLATS